MKITANKFITAGLISFVLAAAFINLNRAIFLIMELVLGILILLGLSFRDSKIKNSLHFFGGYISPAITVLWTSLFLNIISFSRSMFGVEAIFFELSVIVIYNIICLIILIFLSLNNEALPAKGNFFKIVFVILTLYCILNLVAWLIGFESVQQQSIAVNDDGKLGSLIGINIKRVQFPFASGVNSFGIIVGAVLLYNIIILASKFKFANFIVVFLLSYMLILIDGRGTFASLILSLFLTYLLFKIKFRYLFAFITSFILMLVFGFDYYNFEFLSRDEGGTLFTNREFIWAAILISVEDSFITNLFGYGAYGHYVSGAADLYSLNFPVDMDPAMIFAHNSYFQLFLDNGYLGLFLSIFILLFFVIYFRRMFEKHACLDYVIGVALIMYLMLHGITEVVFSFYQPLIMLINFSIFYLFLNANYFERRISKILEPRINTFWV